MRDPFISEGWAEKLHVLCMISNPLNYNSRYELFFEFQKHMQDAGVILWVAEVAYGERTFVCTKKDNPLHLQLRSGGLHEKGVAIWIKERALNLLLQKVPKEAQYLMWADADIHFSAKNFPEKIIQKLQFHDFIQPWSHAQDLGPNDEPLNKKPEISFCSAWCNNMPMDWDHKKYSSGTGHPGYAWAARRKALDDVGGLIDWAILGSGDRHMAFALVDKVLFSAHPKIHPVYRKMLKIWQVRARHYINRNIGYLPGLITHKHHSNKSFRKYASRWQILVKHQFNPELDLKTDCQGLYTLTERNWELKKDILAYFSSRNEDDIRVD